MNHQDFPWQKEDLGIEIYIRNTSIFAKKAEIFNCREGSYLIVDDVTVKKEIVGQAITFILRGEVYAEEGPSRWIPMKDVNELYHYKSETPEWMELSKEEAKKRLEEKLAKDREKTSKQKSPKKDSSLGNWLSAVAVGIGLITAGIIFFF